MDTERSRQEQERARETHEETPLEPVELTAPRGTEPEGLRCPYCHVTIPFGVVGAACETCGGLHHVACFAERDGCSATGCAGKHARTGPARRPPDPRLRCAGCREPLASDAWVLRCACGRTIHTTCAPEGSCGRSGCAQSARVGRLGLLQARDRATALWLGVLFAGISSAAVAVAALTAALVGLLARLSQADQMSLAGVSISGIVIGAVLALVTLLLARRWRHALRAVEELAAAPPPRPAPDKGSGPEA